MVEPRQRRNHGTREKINKNPTGWWGGIRPCDMGLAMLFRYTPAFPSSLRLSCWLFGIGSGKPQKHLAKRRMRPLGSRCSRECPSYPARCRFGVRLRELTGAEPEAAACGKTPSGAQSSASARTSRRARVSSSPEPWLVRQ